MKEEILDEMEHIDAQEHFSSCLKCQKIFNRKIGKALSQQKQELLKGIEKKFRLLPDCITLGISEKNWNSLKKQLTN